MKSKLYLGWDIGGANTKICVFDSSLNIIDIHTKNIKIWADFRDIKSFFTSISEHYNNFEVYNFITITAESCDNFKDRSCGILEILNKCNLFINGNNLYYTNLNTYIDFNNAIKSTENLFSTNWILTSKFLDTQNNIDLIIDVGSTTTDFIHKGINIENNINDYKRLSNHTLLYLGVVRTPLSMMTNAISFNGTNVPLINEVFATTGDVFNITNDIDFSELDYLGSDDLKFTKENSLVRIARIIGLDFDETYKNNLINVSNQFKELYISKIINNIKIIFKNNINDLTISSVGEGRFLIKEMCKKYNIKYRLINDLKFNFIKNVDKNKVYSNMTAALVVINFQTKKNHA